MPSLRNVAVTAPYFHDGQAADLETAVRFHVELGIHEEPRFLDPRLADKDGTRHNFDLSKDDIDSLVLFLKALNGEEVDRFVANNPH